MVQDDADIPRRSSPRYAASSLLGLRSVDGAFSLIMPGSRVRVPPLLFAGEGFTFSDVMSFRVVVPKMLHYSSPHASCSRTPSQQFEDSAIGPGATVRITAIARTLKQELRAQSPELADVALLWTGDDAADSDLVRVRVARLTRRLRCGGTREHTSYKLRYRIINPLTSHDCGRGRAVARVACDEH